MKGRLFLIIIWVFLGNYLWSQYNIFQSGIQIYTTKTGWNISGNKITFNERYTFTKDTCISGLIYIILDKEYSLQNNWYPNNPKRVLIYFDTIQKKIFNGGELIYDFTIQVDSSSKWGFTLDSVRMLKLGDSLHKFYFFSDRNNPAAYKRYDIWLENFGSIVLDYLSPFHNISPDGYNLSYNPKINFGNKIQLTKSENEVPHTNFKLINKIIDKELPMHYKSYRCNGNIDSILIYDKCFHDTNFSYSVDYYLDISKQYFCNDTVFYHYTIKGRKDNKLVYWENANHFSKVRYPSSNFEKPKYSNQISIMNLDSSCQTKYNYDSIVANCKYCDDPENNPKLTISINNDTFCRDSLTYSVSSSGKSDSLWIKHSPPIDYARNGTYNVTILYGNRHCVTDSLKKVFFVNCINSLINNTYSNGLIEISPNPILNICRIHGINITMPVEFTIYDLMGKNVLQGNTTGLIDLSTLSNGNYILTLLNEKYSHVVKRIEVRK